MFRSNLLRSPAPAAPRLRAALRRFPASGPALAVRGAIEIGRKAASHERKLLVVDDSPMNRMLLSDILSEDYDMVEAEDGEEAVEYLAEHWPEVDLVILDIVMPKMDGFEVPAKMNGEGWIERVPVVTISAESSPTYVERAYGLGVTDFITRPFDALVVRHRVANTIALYQKQRRLMKMVSSQMYEKGRKNNLMVSILSHIVEFRNGESGLHVLHIGTMTDILLNKLIEMDPDCGVDPKDVSTITMASALHDIGKIAIPGSILNKPGRLTKEEFEVIKKHSEIGAGMLSELPFQREEKLVKIAHDICRWHHERYDGRGYPDGLTGEDIPVWSQVVAMADVYDALTSERVYKPAYSHEKAIEMIQNGECGAFSPRLLACLDKASEDIRAELRVNSLSSMSRREMSGLVAEIRGTEYLSESDKDAMIEDIEELMTE